MDFALDINVDQLSIPGRQLINYLASVTLATNTYKFKELDVVDMSNHIFNSLFKVNSKDIDLDILRMYLADEVAEEIYKLLGKASIKDIPVLPDFKVIRYALTCATINELCLEGILHKTQQQDVSFYILDKGIPTFVDFNSLKVFGLQQPITRSYSKYLEVTEVKNDSVTVSVNVNGEQLICNFGIGMLVYITEAVGRCSDEDVLYTLLSLLEATTSRGDVDPYQDQRMISQLRCK